MEEYFKNLREFRSRVVGIATEGDSFSDKLLSLLILRYLLFLEAQAPIDNGIYESTMKLVENIEQEESLDYFIHKLWLLNAINRYRCFVLHRYEEALDCNRKALAISFDLLNRKILQNDLEIKSSVLIFYFNKIRLLFYQKNYLRAKELLMQFDLLINQKISAFEISDLKDHALSIDELVKRFDDGHRNYYLSKSEKLKAKIEITNE